MANLTPYESCIAVDASSADGLGLPINGNAEAISAWERDSANAPALTLYQTSAWAKIAVRYDLATGRRPILLSHRDQSGQRFSIPLSIARERGVLVARLLAEPLAEYGGAIGPVSSAGLRAALLDLRKTYGVDLVVLRRVPCESSLGAASAALCAPVGGMEAPLIRLANNGPLLSPSGGRSQGYANASRLRRRMQRDGDYAFNVYPGNPSVRQAVELALEWKKDWAREQRLISRMIYDDAHNAVMCDLLSHPTLEACVGVLQHRGAPVAIECGFVQGDRFFADLRAYRPDRRTDGVGHAAMAEMVEWAARRGLAIYDKGPPALRYKIEWSRETMHVADRVLPLSGLGTLRHQFEDKLKPIAKAAFWHLPLPIRESILALAGYKGRNLLGRSSEPPVTH